MTLKKNVIESLEQNSSEIESFGVERIGLFGSVVREEEDEKRKKGNKRGGI
jgi:predicted nucleotidyltransferase